MHTIAALPKEIGGEKVVYIPLDDESDPTKGSQNARRLVLQDGVDILIGSSVTPVTMTMLDVASEVQDSDHFAGSSHRHRKADR